MLRFSAFLFRVILLIFFQLSHLLVHQKTELGINLTEVVCWPIWKWKYISQANKYTNTCRNKNVYFKRV